MLEMSIVNAFKQLFYSTYNGQNPKRDFEILISRYFPSNPIQSEVTVYRELAPLPNISTSPETCNTVDEKFKRILVRVRDNVIQAQEFTNFRFELEQVNNSIAKFGNFISLFALENSLEETRSLAGIFNLGLLIGIHENTKLLSLKNKRGYVVPSHITKKQLESTVAAARREATHYGSVFPYEKLDTLPEWGFIPSGHRKRFAQELLFDTEGFLELGDKEFFGFSNITKDRIRSRLIKIYSVYEEVSTETLVKTLKRTLKSKSRVDKSILEECADVYDEYCLKAGYCLDKGDYLLTASPKLKALIKQHPPNDEKGMYAIEKKLVSALRRNGAQMDTKSFIPVMEENNANQSYVMEFATLIYRAGWRNNSSYHTLDDHYGEISGGSLESQNVDRKRIEINRINRDNRLSRKAKRLCEHKCQICGQRIQTSDDSYYSEVHHIQPLGQPHFGPDSMGNMLCVCPNDHVMLDYGVIPLDITKLHFIEANPVSEVYIDYHNKYVFRQHE